MMSNEWKMVPVEPTDDMIVAFAEAWYSKRQCIDDTDMLDAYRDMLAVAPVPPAGDMEVDRWEFCQNETHIMPHGDWVTYADHRAHVTRLTAERDGLLAEVESYKRGFWGRMAARNQIALRKSDAELTKARELLALQSKVIEFATIIDKQAFAKGTQNVGVAAFRAMGDALSDLAHQSAPAAKGDE